MAPDPPLSHCLQGERLGGRKASRRQTTLTRVLLVVLVALLVASAGCWSRRELETLAIVTAAGVDLEPESGLIALTVHVIRPEVAGDPDIGERPYAQVRTTGRTLFEASRNALQQLPTRLYWAHNHVLVFGEEAARAGLTPILDFFERDAKTRYGALVMVAAGTTANELLKAEYELQPITSLGMERQIESLRDLLSTSVRTELIDLVYALTGQGAQPLLTRIERFAKPSTGDPIGDLERDEISESPIVGGAAVFVEDRLVGWLEPLETRGLHWITGTVRGALVVVPDPWHQGQQIGLAMDSSTSEIKFTEIAPGRLGATVRITAHAEIGDMQAHVDHLHMSDFEALVQAALEAAVEAEARSALDRCQQQFRSDVFTLGATLWRQNPGLWRRFGDQWDRVFPELEVQIQVRGRILRSGTNLGFLVRERR